MKSRKAEKSRKENKQMKRNDFKLLRDAGDILCSITLRSAGGMSFKTPCRVQGPPHQGLVHSRRRRNSGLDMSSQRCFGVSSPCLDYCNSLSIGLPKARFAVCLKCCSQGDCSSDTLLPHLRLHDK